MNNRVVGNGRAIRLEPRVMDVLVYLMRSAGHTITHDDLHEHVWTGVVVDESAVRRTMSQIRKAFDDDAAAPAYIETIRKTGYRLIAPVSSFSGGDEIGVEIVPHNAQPRRSGLRHIVAPALVVLLVAAAAMVVIQKEPDSPPIPLPGTQVTSASGMELRPRLSPDGSFVAYAADRGEPSLDLYVQIVGADGPLQLTATPEAETAPAWSPAGRRIAFMRMGDVGACAIYTISVLGGDEQKVSECGGSAHASLAWSPDGRLLAYPLREDPTGPFRIVLLDIKTLDRRYLTAPSSNRMGDIHPLFSRDGKTVAFVRAARSRIQDLYAISLSGGEPRRLTNHAGFIAGYDWAPDDQSLVMSSNQSGRFKLWRVPMDGGSAVWLANVAAYDPGSPSLSRNGGRLVYEEWSFDFNIWQHNLKNGEPDGAPERVVRSTRWDIHPHFSPDAARIAFTSNRTGSHELWAASPDGGQPLRLTSFTDGYVSAPHWSPDGREIAFELRSGGTPGIYVVDADGGTPRLLAKGGVAPSWSRDGASIYFGFDGDGAWKLLKIPAGGGVAVPAAEGAYTAQEDFGGRTLFYTKYGVPGLWRRPFGGGRETLVVQTLDPDDAESWDVTEDGIYFVDRSEGFDQILFFDFRSKSSRLVLRPAQPIPLGKASLAVSPDGSALLYGQIDERESDIMLVEGLH